LKHFSNTLRITPSYIRLDAFVGPTYVLITPTNSNPALSLVYSKVIALFTKATNVFICQQIGSTSPKM
jgi:hypothetical protein